MREEIIKQIGEIVGKDHMSCSPWELRNYAYVSGHGGDFFDGKPDVVVMPQTAQQISEIVKLANETLTPVVPRAAGTNQFGMNICHKGGILIDMALMDKILEIDEDNMVVVAEAGTSTYKVMYDLDKHNLQFPISPLYTSAPQIGAAVACNITGCYMTRFGNMGDNITGLEVVMPTGEIVTFGSKALKNNCGYYFRYVGGPDLIGLFVNAGGTTGIITKVAVRVKPKPPANEVLSYGWRRDQAQTLTEAMYILQRNFIYDYVLLNRWNYQSAIDRKRVTLPEDTHFIAILSIDARSKEELRYERDRVCSICEKHEGVDLGDLGDVTIGPPYYAMWLSVSKWMQRIQATYFYHPIKKFPEIYDIFENITRKYGFWDAEHTPAWFSFHGRNTINPYPMLAVSNPLDEGEKRRIKLWWDELNTALVDVGCTQYLLGDSLPQHNAESLGPLYDLMLKIKRALDPNNIMNPSRTYGGL